MGCGISLVHNYYDLDKNGNLVPKVVSENQEIIKKIRDALEKTNFLAVFNSLEGDARSRVA